MYIGTYLFLVLQITRIIHLGLWIWLWIGGVLNSTTYTGVLYARCACTCTFWCIMPLTIYIHTFNICVINPDIIGGEPIYRSTTYYSVPAENKSCCTYIVIIVDLDHRSIHTGTEAFNLEIYILMFLYWTQYLITNKQYRVRKMISCITTIYSSISAL